MNTHEANLSSHSSEHLDRMLTEFFQGSMPKKWPVAPVAEIEPSTRRNDAVFGKATEPAGASRSRLTLAASLAGLFVLGTFLSYGSSSPTANVAKVPGVIKESSAGSKYNPYIMPYLNQHRTNSGR